MLDMHEVIGSIPTVSTINKQSRFIGSVLFLVEMVWMRSHVQAASIKEDLHSVATIGSGGQLAAPLAGRGSDSCGADAAVSTRASKFERSRYDGTVRVCFFYFGYTYYMLPPRVPKWSLSANYLAIMAYIRQ